MQFDKILHPNYVAGCMLAFGIAFALLLPPFQSPDEPEHFLRAYQVSEGAFFPENSDSLPKGGRLGGVLPASLALVCDSFAFLKNNHAARLNNATLVHTLAVRLQPDRRSFLDFPNTAAYAPTAYLPQAGAIALSRFLGAPPLQMLYAARLANLLIWTLLVWLALRMLPFCRSVAAAMALLPASLVIGSSANADVLTNGLCWWLVAGFASNALLPRFLPFAVVCANKLIAVPLGLLWWLHRPTERSKHLLEGFGFLVVGCAVALWWGGLAKSWFIPYDAYDPAFRDRLTLNSGVDPTRQLEFVANNPGSFVKTVAVSLTGAAPSTAAHFVGKFGWEKNYLPAGWLAALWGTLAALLCVADNPLTLRQRFLLLGVAALFVGGLSLTLYAKWSPVGSSLLDIWQGRYLVPIALVLALAGGNAWLRKWEKWIVPLAGIILISSNLAMVWSIWIRYWAR